jgi:hypothetical protein
VHNNSIDQIRIYHPYRALFPLNPKKVESVGDQVISEHIFGYHSKESMRDDRSDVLSHLEFSTEESRVIISPKVPIKRSDGTHYALEDMCMAIKSGLREGHHAPYRALLKSVTCLQERVEITFEKIPVNLPFLFTLPDLSLFDENTLPIRDQPRFPATTGPYSLEAITENETRLKINPHYPRSLRANEISTVAYRTYQGSTVVQFVEKLDPKEDHLIYFVGDLLTSALADKLKSKGYRLQIFPSEWLLYFQFTQVPSENLRKRLGRMFDLLRERLVSHLDFAQAAYSIAPMDRPFGLKKDEYTNAIKTETPHIGERDDYPLRIGLLANTERNPNIQMILGEIRKFFPNIQIRFLRYEEWEKAEKELDVLINALGISQFDPLNHISYLMHQDPLIRETVTDNDVAELASTHKRDDFISKVKDLESTLARERRIFPLAHFPGIVAEAPGFDRDEELSWNWGTQAWTYRVR